MLEAARKAGARKIVTSSSAGIFGELKTLPIREDHPVEPDSPYGATKLCKEKQCLVYAKLYDMEAVCLRYFNVYGPNQRFDAYGNVIPIFAFQMLRGEALTIFGDGEQTRDFVNVRDVVQANLKAAMSRGVSGAFNIGSGTRVTDQQACRSAKGRVGIDAKVRHGPDAARRCAGQPGRHQRGARRTGLRAERRTGMRPGGIHAGGRGKRRKSS